MSPESFSCGIDFGTTNSVVAVARPGHAPEVIASQPSCILITSGRTGERLRVGQDALEHYLRVDSPARFIKSMKLVLPDPGFISTNVFGRLYAPEHLVRPVLSDLKRRAEVHVGQPVTKVTLGRPVRFSTDPEADDLAQSRLEKAAALAGLESVRLEREPVAAAWSYATRISEPATILVADLGGGTTDFTAMRLSPNGEHRILSVGGVRIGGDELDGLIMWNKLVSVFGYGTRYESWGKMLDVPPHIYRALCRWDRIPFLKDSKTRQDLRYMLTGAEDRPALERLRLLIDEDLGWALFRAIAEAKHRLSEDDQSEVVFEHDTLAVRRHVLRQEFEQMIHPEVDRIVSAAAETLEDANLEPGEVDVCFLTGGTSMIPLVHRTLGDLLGKGKIRSGETFTSVATGLALRGLRGLAC